MQALGVGALAGLIAFLVSEPVGNFAEQNAGFLAHLWSSMKWSGAIGAALGAALLVYDNLQSLRGAWARNMAVGVALFFVLGMLSGGAGQAFYAFAGFFLSQTETASWGERIARAIGWSFLGVGVGVGIGLLRRDSVQAWRGALGGLLGGFLGGFLFDALAQNSTGNGALSRGVGLVLMGAAIALGRFLVQEVLKSAWLLGISTGPYEGREAPLTKARVSVGRDAGCDIALLRDETVTPHHGALIFENGGWNWRGEVVKIDGLATQSAPLSANCVIEFGAAKFRFLDRSRHTADVAVIAGLPPVQNRTQNQNPTGNPTRILPPARPSHPVCLVLRSESALLWPELRLAEGKSETTIGRAPGSDFVLSEATVSSHHARLFWSDVGLQLCDENSSNGTRVNGEKIAPGTRITLREGDRVAFGKVEYIAVRE